MSAAFAGQAGVVLDRGLDAELASLKYARPELERRWRVEPGLRPPVEDLDFVVIDDRYLTGTRLRLRQMTRSDGWTACKLTKKYESDRPEARPIVTTYLTEAEHALFAALSAHPLRKRRYHVPLGGQLWSLDLFEGALEGLELVEIEAPDEATLGALVPPSWVTKEVTHDPRYHCGSLAQTNAVPE
jgi:CYTH domain-containing protein